jgi:hypothetical protein
MVETTVVLSFLCFRPALLFRLMDHFCVQPVDTLEHLHWKPAICMGAMLANNADTEKKSCSRDRCYDHNFLRFLTIFGEKMAFFLKNQCYDQFFHNLALF